MNISCSHCGTTNRIPEDRLGDGPKCGKCKEPIFSGKPDEINVAVLDAMISKNETPVVVDFWAPWCGPCVGMAPAYAEAAKALQPEVRLLKLNTQEHQDINARFGIRGIPTLIMFAGGKEVARKSGAMGKEQIEAWVKQSVPAPAA